MNFEINELESKKEWDEFVSNSEQNNIFSKSFFLDHWYENYKLYFIKEKKIILAGFILGIKNKFKPDSAFPYQGIILSKNFDALKNHSKLKKYVDMFEIFISEKKKYLKNLRFSLHYSVKDIRPFLWHNHENILDKGSFNVDIRYTAVLNLKKKNFLDILAEFRSARKEDLKKFSKKNFEIETSNDISILDELHIKTFRRQDKKRSENEKYLATILSKELLKNKLGRLVICKYEKKPISAVMIAYDDLKAYYLIGANDPDFRDSGSNTALLVNQLKYLIENKFQMFDFMGVNSPKRGDFKLSFNPEMQQYFNISFKV